MGKSVMQVSDVSMEKPLEDLGGTPDQTISTDVVTLSDAGKVPLDEHCTSVRIAFTGSGDVRVRLDGGTPSASSGELWFQGGFLKVNRNTYEQIKMIRAGGTDGAVHVTQMTGGKLG